MGTSLKERRQHRSWPEVLKREIVAADSEGSRPGFRDDLARHSEMMSLGIPE
jgi:hypothetical protein